MKHARLLAQKVMQKRQELLCDAVRRRERAHERYRTAPWGERTKRLAELKAAVNSELRASW